MLLLLPGLARRNLPLAPLPTHPALQCRRWVLSVLLYSAAVSIKMNVLLMAPGVLAALLLHARLVHLAAGVAGGVALQLALGYPFLAAYPVSYVTRAFEFSRVS